MLASIEAARAAMPLASFFFDLLYLEGEGALVSLPSSASDVTA